LVRDVEFDGRRPALGKGQQGYGLAVLGVALAAEGDVFPGDAEGVVDEEALEQGRGQAHLRVGDMVFAQDEVFLLLADQVQGFLCLRAGSVLVDCMAISLEKSRCMLGLQCVVS
jgi:hypothetical protein